MLQYVKSDVNFACECYLLIFGILLEHNTVQGVYSCDYGCKIVVGKIQIGLQDCKQIIVGVGLQDKAS